MFGSSSQSTLMPHPKPVRPVRKRTSRSLSRALPVLGSAFVLAVGFFSIPSIVATDIELSDTSAVQSAFPVTVNPSEKTITEDPAVEALLDQQPSSLSASASSPRTLLTWLAVKISNISAYQQIAGAAGIHSLFVTVLPGYREEQVAQSVGKTLGWTPGQRLSFTKNYESLPPGLTEGTVVPGTYFLSASEPKDVATLMHERFEKEIMARYSTSTEEQVPLEQALTIASLLQREAGDWEDMRLISGVIWNRLFSGMKLQIDATLQYAEANNTKGAGGWWPSVEPKDKYIKSAYNTYQKKGLPPGPIANPSIAAVLAALNPKKTDCLFYFHDSQGQFHCTKTYKEHVAMLKKYYGQGK